MIQQCVDIFVLDLLNSCWKVIRLLEYINLFSPNEYEKIDKKY